LCEKCDDIVTYAGSGHHLLPDRIEPDAPYFGKSLSVRSRTINTRFSTVYRYIFQLSCVNSQFYTNTHEQQLYCIGTLSQMTERSAERRVRQETGWLAGGPLVRVPTIRRTADTHYRHIALHFSHNERTPVQISLQYRNWC
jgi:hypothetical protein